MLIRRRIIPNTQTFQTGKPLHGYYMVAEATSQRTSHKALLYSPSYSQSDSVNACFKFYYHMFGAVVGTLRVYVKPLTGDFNQSADMRK